MRNWDSSQTQSFGFLRSKLQTTRVPKMPSGIVQHNTILQHAKLSDSLLKCRIELLNFSMGFNIIAPYIEIVGCPTHEQGGTFKSKNGKCYLNLLWMKKGKNVIFLPSSQWMLSQTVTNCKKYTTYTAVKSPLSISGKPNQNASIWFLNYKI